jgi:hypothetical protein
MRWTTTARRSLPYRGWFLFLHLAAVVGNYQAACDGTVIIRRRSKPTLKPEEEGMSTLTRIRNVALVFGLLSLAVQPVEAVAGRGGVEATLPATTTTTGTAMSDCRAPTMTSVRMAGRPGKRPAAMVRIATTGGVTHPASRSKRRDRPLQVPTRARRGERVDRAGGSVDHGHGRAETGGGVLRRRTRLAMEYGRRQLSTDGKFRPGLTGVAGRGRGSCLQRDPCGGP